jgi:hypothetical protein
LFSTEAVLAPQGTVSNGKTFLDVTVWEQRSEMLRQTLQCTALPLTRRNDPALNITGPTLRALH